MVSAVSTSTFDLSVSRQTPVGDIDVLFTQRLAYDDLAARLRSVLDGQDSSRHANC